MEAIAEPDQTNRNYVVYHKLPKVSTPLLYTKNHYESLLDPESGLEQVVELERRIVCLVWILFIHPLSIEIPHGCMFHAVYPQRSNDCNIHSSVHLLHEPRLFSSRLDSEYTSQRL